MRRRVTATVVSLLGAAMIAYPVLDAIDAVPGVLTSDWSMGSPARGPATAVPAATPVAGLDPNAPPPVPTALAEDLRPLLGAPALGPGPGAMIVDAATGASLLTVNEDVPRTPASTVKVLTAAAVAADADVSVTRRTRVVTGPTAGTVVLVADGDTLLARETGNPYATAGRAGLADLAAATATALREQRTGTDERAAPTPVSVLLDDRVATGPALPAGWKRADLDAGFTGAVTMLGLADDRALPGRPASADPAMTAALAFRDALRATGLEVSDPVTRVPRDARTQPDDARGVTAAGTELASVESAPVADVLSLALAESDNALTEVVARRAFVETGVPTTFEAAGAHVISVLDRLGVSTDGLRLLDTSGLSRGSTTTVRTVTETVSLAATDRLPRFARIIADLPVAGLTGTLHGRFVTPAAADGRGVVRGKTGTLADVGALVGTLVDSSGRLLVYGVIADAAPTGATSATRAALDALVTAVVTCACGPMLPTGLSSGRVDG